MPSEMIENIIALAENRLDDGRYADWCLSFIEDALEKSNGIEVFGGDSAKKSAELYADAMENGEPPRGVFVFYDCLCLDGDKLVNRGHCGIGLGNGRVIHACGQERRLSGHQAADRSFRRPSPVHRLGAHDPSAGTETRITGAAFQRLFF